MSIDTREEIIERILDTNYYLSQAMLKGEIDSIKKYKQEQDNLINYILNEKSKKEKR